MTQQPPKKHFIKSCIGIIIINTLCHPHHQQQHSPLSTISSAGHTHLLSHNYGINGDSPSEQDSPTTILSRQFDGTQSLFEVAARLADGKDLLNDALTTITDKNTTTKMTNFAIKVIRKSVLSLMDIASTQSQKTANLQFGWSHCWRKLCPEERGDQQKEEDQIIKNH
jgi:hypothetical protein